MRERERARVRECVRVTERVSERERVRDRTQNSELYYSRIKILGKNLVLQSVLAKITTRVYAKYSGITK